MANRTYWGKIQLDHHVLFVHVKFKPEEMRSRNIFRNWVPLPTLRSKISWWVCGRRRRRGGRGYSSWDRERGGCWKWPRSGGERRRWKRRPKSLPKSKISQDLIIPRVSCVIWRGNDWTSVRPWEITAVITADISAVMTAETYRQYFFLSANRPIQFLTAEIAIFGRKWEFSAKNEYFRPKIHIYIYRLIGRYSFFGRNSHFRPKNPIFGRKSLTAVITVSAEKRLSRGPFYRYRCFGKKSLSVAH